jgi:hypothetical protein
MELNANDVTTDKANEVFTTPCTEKGSVAET